MSCNCHCNNKCQLLGGLEQQIMEVLWSSKESLKPADVLRQLKGEHAYTTVMTVLKRLADKKLVTRKSVGNAFIYTPIKDKESFACSCLEDLFTRLFDCYGESVVTSFKKVIKKTVYKS